MKITFSCKGIDFIYKNNSWGILSSFLKQFSYATSPHPHIHLIKLRTTLIKKTASRLTCQRTSHQRLTSTWGSGEENSFGEFGSGVYEFLGMFKVIDEVF